VSLARNNLKNFIFVLLQESASKLEQQMQQIDKEKCNLQEENQKLLQQKCELQDSLELSKTSLKDAENELITLKAAEAAKIQLLGDEKIELLESNNQLNVILLFLFVEQNHSQTSHSITRYFSHFFIRH
jgi:hypothetical protein